MFTWVDFFFEDMMNNVFPNHFSGTDHSSSTHRDNKIERIIVFESKIDRISL